MVDPDPVVGRGHIAADKESGILLSIDNLLRKPNSSTSTILGFGCPDAHCFTFASFSLFPPTFHELPIHTGTAQCYTTSITMGAFRRTAYISR